MTREIYDSTHYVFLPDRVEYYPNIEIVKAQKCSAPGYRDAQFCDRSETFECLSHFEPKKNSSALWIAGRCPTCALIGAAVVQAFPANFLPQTDGRAPAMYAPETLPSFSRPCWGIAAAESREASNAYGVAASWERAYARRSISLNRRRSKLTHQRVRKSASFCLSNCFYENFGQKIGSRTTCASLAQSSRQPSAERPASILLIMRKSPRSCAANMASNFYSTSWAMRGHPGSRLSLKPRTSARCVGKSQNSNAGSHRWKWASNKEAA